jgi:hypothetical protein
MKKTFRFLLFITLVAVVACSSDKKKHRAMPAENIQVEDSQVKNNSLINTAPPVAPSPGDSGTPALSATAVEQPYDTINEYLYKGLMIYKDNVGEFIDCNNQRVYYINDRTNRLRGEYYSFQLPANGPLYVEVVGIYVKPDAKAPRKYKRQMNISHLNVMDRDVPFNCGGALTKAKESN